MKVIFYHIVKVDNTSWVRSYETPEKYFVDLDRAIEYVENNYPWAKKLDPNPNRLSHKDLVRLYGSDGIDIQIRLVVTEDDAVS